MISFSSSIWWLFWTCLSLIFLQVYEKLVGCWVIELMEQKVFRVEKVTLFKEQKGNNIKLKPWTHHSKSVNSIKLHKMMKVVQAWLSMSSPIQLACLCIPSASTMPYYKIGASWIFGGRGGKRNGRERRGREGSK